MRVFFAILAIASLTYCGSKLTPEQARGRAVYMGQCTACHNANPNIDGALGPAVQGSSVELLRARILDASYPEGYKPKRDTNTMTKLPLSDEEINELAAFLK